METRRLTYTTQAHICAVSFWFVTQGSRVALRAPISVGTFSIIYDYR